jgi:hypothetical protein
MRINLSVIMKKTILFSLAFTLILFTACQGSAAKKVTSSNSTANSAAENTAVTAKTRGEKVTTTFSFTNTGDADLIIVDARGSCGCTVPEYPKNKPIAPGETGSIVVSFDSSNKPGVQQKSVTLSANTASGREMLRIKSNVTPDPVKQQQREAQAKARQQN